MRRIARFSLRSLAFLSLSALLPFAAGCGGGGGAPTGDRTGNDTLPVIVDLQTPLGVQGTRGVGPDVSLVYHVRDREFDPATVEVQYGVDLNRDGTVTEDEFRPATPGPGGDGTQDLNTSPGVGAVHSFVWNTLADISSGRWVTQDYVYTKTGRVALDDFGEPIFQSFPGTVVRMRPMSNGKEGAWRYSDPFDVNNNNRPSVTVGSVDIPPEGAADGTVNEQVLVHWTGIDPDADPLTIAVDWVSVPEGYDPGTQSQSDLEGLPWSPATGGSLGEGTYDLSASPTGLAHSYSWDSVADAGTVNKWVLLRFRPIDGKLEVGDWFYATSPFHLDNYTIFTDPDASLPAAVSGSRSVLLSDENVEAVLVTGGSATAGGPGTHAAYVFYPGATQTTKGVIASVPGGMQEARAGHTATRLLDGRVLVAGGRGSDGTVLDSAEIYDPATRKFALLPSHLSTGRAGQVAVLLQSGDVLLAGGTDANGDLLSSGEVFHALTDTFSPVSASLSMGDARTGAAGTLLPDGRVLVAGGHGSSGALATVEIYDPSLGGFGVTDTGNDLSQGREGLTLTGTLDKTYAAVAAGGMASPPTSTLDRFDWQTDAFRPSSVEMRTGRAYHSAVLLGDGRILLAGGEVDESGTLTATADIYDPKTDTMDVPNGEMLTAVRDSSVAMLKRGRPVFFGGMASDGATDAVQVFTPDGGFNERPLAQVADMLGAVEPWSFGVRIRWRAIDAEGDPVRIVCQYRIKPSSSDDSSSLPDAIKDKWLPATMRAQTVLGEKSSGLTALSSRSDFVDTVDNPIDAPDVDPGEHLFVWYTEKDIPKGDYDNVFFRIFVYGAEEGTGVESARFSIAKNAPVIARIQAPLNTSGNLVVPFYLQDSDEGQLARLVWEYGLDKNGDGKIVESDGESWSLAKHSPVTVTLGGSSYTDAGTTDVVSGSKNPDPNNDYTDPSGIPWGKKHYFIWDSVYDLGAPDAVRSDVILRLTPYDYPAGKPGSESLGISQTRTDFALEKDPDGLYLTKWYPSVAGPDGTGAYSYAGVKTDEPLVFEFTGKVDPASLTAPDGPEAIEVMKDGGSTLVTGYFAVDNSSGKGVVTFYPQVQEVPSRTDVLTENTGYSVKIWAYTPSDRTHPVVQRLGADPEDTNARVLLRPSTDAKAFQTGTGVLSDGTSPSYATRLTPSADTGVSTTSGITVEIDDRLLPSSVTPGSFEVVAKTFGGVESVVPGSYRLENIVDESGPGGTLRKYAKLTLSPDLLLPPDTTEIEVRIGTGLMDLAGNALSSSATSTFTTAAGTSTVTAKKLESFDDTTNRDASLTTAFWGTADPANKGAATGSGTAGKLTGLYDGGNGSDGVLDLTGGDKTLTSSSSKKEWQFSSVKIPSGRTLTLKGTEPITIRVQNDVQIDGTVDASGAPGQDGFDYPTSGTNAGATGGKGGPGGGDGGSDGKYTYKQTASVNGGNGASGAGDSAGKGGGTGGKGPNYGSGISSYWAGGGGGGAHASAGLSGADGYTSYGKMGGAGGSAYGSSTLKNGLEAGSGGGAGGASVMAYVSNSWYGAASGGGGGGGGGGLMFAANGKITVSSSGKIAAGGGKGGAGEYGYAWTTVYPGGGGGGGGGTIALQCGDFDVSGTIDVLGGAGGPNQGSSYDGAGGAGGDGLIRLERPNFSGKLFNGKTYTSSTLVTAGSSGQYDWKVTADTLINTDTGLGVAPPLSMKNGKVSCRDFILDATLTVEGSKPLVIESSGKVEIRGKIVANGKDGANASQSYYSSSSGFYFQLAKAGTGGPGGFDGGDNGGSAKYSSSKDKPTDGIGTNGKAGGPGAGKAGVADSPYTRYSGSYVYYYYYYSGGGGGAGGAVAGTEGTVTKYLGSYSGTPGKAGDAGVDPADLSTSNIFGGAGGGGGANGAYYYKTTSTYYYSWGPGAAGGGGGGAVAIATKGTMLLSGTIQVAAGNGGNCFPTSTTYMYWSGPGGGGAGGNVLLQAEGGFTFGLMMIDAAGGKGGISKYSTYPTYVTGGDGGVGGIALRAKGGVTLPGDLPSGAKYGNGSFSGGDYTPTKYGVSVWFDSGAVAPEYVSRTLVDNGGGKLWVQGAQTDLLTGKADESNATAWLDASSGDLSGLNGCRWFRFKVELVPVANAYPEVSSVQMDWKYRK